MNYTRAVPDTLQEFMSEFNPSSARIDFRRQNLTSIVDPRAVSYL